MIEIHDNSFVLVRRGSINTRVKRNNETQINQCLRFLAIKKDDLPLIFNGR